jgi:putative transposase
MPSLFFHKDIRLPASEHLGTKSFFITVCSARRRPLFTNPRLAMNLLQLRRNQAVRHAFDVHAYCLMPDHLHFLAQGTQQSCDWRDFVRIFRLNSSRFYMQKTGQPLWQKKYFDCILRSGASRKSVAWYIWMNPVRKGLCCEGGRISVLWIVHECRVGLEKADGGLEAGLEIETGGASV